MDILYLHRGQQFVWDAEKSAGNFAKHGIHFEACCEVFFDPFVHSIDASTDDEYREAAIGMTEDWTMLFVVNLIRKEDWIRIISARPVTTTERKLYEDCD